MARKAALSGVYSYHFEGIEKKYIGSSIDIYKRDSHHKFLLKNGLHTNKHLQNAYNLYGPERLIHRILEVVNLTEGYKKNLKSFKDKIRDVEQMYLDMFFAQECLADRKDRRFYDLLYNKSLVSKFLMSEDFKEVNRYQMSGEYIDTFYNKRLAGRLLKIDPGSIGRVCNRKRLSAGGYIWSYEKLDFIDTERFKNTNLVPINQYDKNKYFVKRFESVKEAFTETGIDVRTTSHCVMQGGYYWLKDGETFKDYKKLALTEEQKKCITNYIETNWESISKYRGLKNFCAWCNKKYNLTTPASQKIFYQYKRHQELIEIAKQKLLWE